MRKTIVENNRIFSDEAVVEFVKKGEYQFLPEIIDRYMPLMQCKRQAFRFIPQLKIMTVKSLPLRLSPHFVLNARL